MASFPLAYSTSESLCRIRNGWHIGKQFTAKAEPNTTPPLLPVINAVANCYKICCGTRDGSMQSLKGLKIAGLLWVFRY